MAILQIEIERSSASKACPTEGLDDREKRLRCMMYDAVRDTMKNGGTFTLVASDTHITAVQHAEPVDLGDQETAP